MLEIASEITLCLLFAALIGFILGFIVAKATGKKTDSQTPSTKEKIPTAPKKRIEDEIETLIDTVTEEESVVNPDAPERLDAPKGNKKDALTDIKGIGPKVEEQLNATGIYHFEQIANWSEANILWLEAHTTFAKRAKKDLWVKQAKALI